MTSTRLSRGIAAAGLVAALALGGCGAHPGSAAVVDGERISESDLDRAVADFAAVTGQQIDSPTMLSTLVVAPMILDVAAEYGVAASDDEASALLDRQAEASGLPVPEDGYGSGVLQIAKMTIVNQTMSVSPDGNAAMGDVNTRITEADVEINPRYGEFDPSGQVVPQALPWIEVGQEPTQVQPAS